MDNGGRQQVPWEDLVSEQVTAIFRFHLALTGSTTAAEQLSRDTFRETVRQAFGFQNRDGPDRKVLLWKTALQQHNSQSYQKFAYQQLTRKPDSEQGGSENQVAYFRVSQVAKSMASLPTLQAGILALLYFGDLDLEFIGRLLHKRASWVERQAVLGFIQLAGQVNEGGSKISSSLADPYVAALAQELNDLAGQISPGTDLASTLTQDVRHPQDGKPFHSISRRIPHWLVIGASIFGVVALAAMNFIFLPHADQQGRVVPTATGTVSDGSGFLVAPDQSVCLSWQTTLSKANQVDFTLLPEAPFADPELLDPNSNGSGCELVAIGTALNLGSLREVISRNDPLLREAGYHYLDEYRSNPACPNCYQFPGDWSGVGREYEMDTGKALLSVGWRPAELSNCQAPISPETCHVPPKQQQITIRLTLAANPVQTQLLRFLERWRSGNIEALSALEPSLREKVSSLSGLALLAGLPANQWRDTVVDWALRTTTSTTALFNIQVNSSTPKGESGDQELSSIDILMAHTPAGWRIREIWSNRFLPTGDTVYGGDQDARLVAVSLDSGISVPLTQPGFYYPGRSSSPGREGTKVRLSPDGAWLAVSFQNGNLLKAAQTGTWLVSTGGAGARTFNPRGLHLVWSPDSHKVIFISPSDPQGLQIETVPQGDLAPFTRLPGAVWGMAWSPDGNWLAATYQTSSPSGSAENQTSIALIRVPTGAIQTFSNLPDITSSESRDPDADLFWTTDSQQVWYGPGMVAIQVATGDLSPLVAQPVDARFSPQQLRALQPTAIGPNFSLEEESPDMAWLARAYTEPYLGGAYRIEIQHFGDDSGNTVTGEIGLIVAMAWTQDASILVAASGVDTSGGVYLINPHNGNTRLLYPELSFIGLRSKMQRDSLHLAPETAVTPQPGPVTSVDQWNTFTSLTFRLHLRYPPEYQLYQFNDGTSHITISSVGFSSPFGFIGIGPDDLYISITRFLGSPLPGPQTFPDEKAWTPVRIGSLDGYQQKQRKYPGGPQVIVIPLFDGQLQVTKFPYSSNLDPTFTQIISSLVIEQP